MVFAKIPPPTAPAAQTSPPVPSTLRAYHARLPSVARLLTITAAARVGGGVMSAQCGVLGRDAVLERAMRSSRAHRNVGSATRCFGARRGTPRRYKRPPLPPARSRMPCARVAKMVPTPRGHRPAGYSQSQGHPLRYLRGVERGCPRPATFHQSIAVTNQPKNIPSWPSPSPTSPATGTAPCPSTTWWATACCCAAAPPACATPAPPRSCASGSASGWPPAS